MKVFIEDLNQVIYQYQRYLSGDLSVSGIPIGVQSGDPSVSEIPIR